ncbi:MAG: 7-cyano-7-deazaguanine synthase QueC [Burkholderiales bacterium]|nr:7-cyano-7-deazaguanine synthase QueC [Burkholderiales bacterium]
MADRAAVVLLSGGLDSAVLLAVARAEGFECHCLSVDYGQRHRAELDAARRVAHALGSVAHKVMRVDLTAIGGSALTDPHIAVPERPSDGIPVTYVPARNTILLSLGLAWAEVLSAADLFIGANSIDYSGYPDCRPEYLHAYEEMANLATRAAVEGASFTVHRPLIYLTKAEIIRRGTDLGVDFSATVSCYQASADGWACGRCDACRLRRAGFEAARLPDPTRYAA